MTEAAASTELVILTAVLRCGGDRTPADVEDVAVEADRLGPGRFRWRKHTQHINLQTVGKVLRDAKQKGLVRGTSANGWMLTDAGLESLQGRPPVAVQSPRSARSQGDRVWMTRERQRLLTEAAYRKVLVGEAAAVTAREAQRFFHLDEYVTGDARRARIDRLLRAFEHDPDLRDAMRQIEGKLP